MAPPAGRIRQGAALYRQRNLIEGGFNKPNKAHRGAIRCDKTAETGLVYWYMTAIRPWLRHLPT
ncbi:transposase [Ruegeria sp. PrR005]|uniref:Transposase n=1 Tax=Ruegeria sp. PrR005 TaxID=2706882 RepID=A0A6B2NN21_9RHOB|nr:transposase [Ruegeria sp. PrR005]